MTHHARRTIQRRTTCLAVFLLGTVLLYWAPLAALARLAWTQEHYSHVLVVPLISAVLFVLERKRIFAVIGTSWPAGLALLGVGAALYAASRRFAGALSANDTLVVVILSAVVVGVAGIALCFGVGALRRGLFPAAFLLLMVPLPDVVLETVVRALQLGTAEVSEILFQLSGVAFLRSGLDFELPGLIVEVAEECSGIRSSMALVLTNLLAGHLFLRSIWAKVVLTLVTIPLLVIKNAIRIVTLSLLSIHVDPGFLTGHLHRRGGAVFFAIALALLGVVLVSLQKAERTSSARLHA